jgi:hypothetical protein
VDSISPKDDDGDKYQTDTDDSTSESETNNALDDNISNRDVITMGVTIQINRPPIFHFLL